MKSWIYIFAVPFVLGGCMTKGAPIGAGAGLNPAGAPIESRGMAGPEVGAPSGTSGSAGAGGGAEDGAGIGGEPSDTGGPADPTAGNDSPITIIGSPTGGTRKPGHCPREFRLCFHDVTVTAKPGGESVLHYEITGFLATQTPGGELAPVWGNYVHLIDALFPDNFAATITQEPLGDFIGSTDAPPGRVLRFEAQLCKHITTLDVALPESSSSPLVLDPCGGTEPTDVGPTHKFPIEFDGVYEFKSRSLHQ